MFRAERHEVGAVLVGVVLVGGAPVFVKLEHRTSRGSLSTYGGDMSKPSTCSRDVSKWSPEIDTLSGYVDRGDISGGEDL